MDFTICSYVILAMYFRFYHYNTSGLYVLQLQTGSCVMKSGMTKTGSRIIKATITIAAFVCVAWFMDSVITRHSWVNIQSVVSLLCAVVVVLKAAEEDP